MSKIKHILISLWIAYVFISLGWVFSVLDHYIEISNISFVVWIIVIVICCAVLTLRIDPSERHGIKGIKAFIQSYAVGHMVIFQFLIYELIASWDIRLDTFDIVVWVSFYITAFNALNNS